MYEPNAAVYDEVIASVKGEWRTRIRMCTRAVMGTLSKRGVFNPLAHPVIAFAILARRISRYWMPYLLLVLGVSGWMIGGWLRAANESCVFVLLVCTAIGMLLRRMGTHVPILTIPLSLVLINVAFLIGTIRAFAGRKIVAYSSNS